MSIAQGSESANLQYFTSLTKRVNAAGSCASLTQIKTQAVSSVNGTISAITSELSQVQQQATNLYNDIANLTGLYATMSASQASMTAIGTVGATASAVFDLGSAIAYIKAQGLAMVSLGSTNAATFVQQALQLATALIKTEYDYNLLVKKISTLEAQLAALPAALASLEATITTASHRFPRCSL